MKVADNAVDVAKVVDNVMDVTNRGREQQLIDKSGGAQSKGGASGKSINGINPTNPKRDL